MVRAADSNFENLSGKLHKGFPYDHQHWVANTSHYDLEIHSRLVFRRVCRICQIRGSLGCESDMVIPSQASIMSRKV